MVDTEHAIVYPMELEARAADRLWDGFNRTPDPDILHGATESLLAEDDLKLTRERTKGGRRIPILHLSDLSRRKTAFEAAARRKRLLQARYLGWASGAPKTPGIVGSAGEKVVRESFKGAEAHGYVLVNREGPVGNILGQPVPGGALDTAAFLTVLRDTTPHTIGLLGEVKNIRGRIYPSSREVYQLLHKAAKLQVAHPERLFAPLLICRKLQHITGLMARELGFYVVDLEVQYISPSVDKKSLQEVRNELGYSDLVPSTGADEKLSRLPAAQLAARRPPSSGTVGADRASAAWQLRGVEGGTA
jgi:hypothetical protein